MDQYNRIIPNQLALGPTREDIENAIGNVSHVLSHHPVRTLPTCQICGAAFLDRKLHVEWHLKYTML